MAYLIDSNVVINYMANNFDSSTLSKLDVVFDTAFNYSVIAFMEVMSYNYSISDLEKFEKLFKSGTQLEINEAVVAETIKIRKESKIKLPDAIIAATAIVHNLKLLTDNTNDFTKVPGLKVISPKNLKMMQ